MGSERFRRFLNLEKPRRAPADEPAPVERGRFGSVEAPSRGGAPATTPVPQEATDRFREPKERPLDVAEPREGAQPFVRCARCEMDNTVYAATCQNCGADLSAPDQRAFNERLWAERREQGAQEKAELAEREKERERMAAAEARARRELAEQMARREGERVRDELDEARWGGTGGWSRRRWGGGWGDDGPDPTPPGIRLLRLIPNAALRIAAVVAAVGLPVLFILVGGRGSGLQVAGMLLLVLVIGLFSPNYRYYRRRGWWNWD